MDILSIILIILGSLIGGLPTLYLIISMFGVLFYKIYRKIRYGASLYD